MEQAKDFINADLRTALIRSMTNISASLPDGMSKPQETTVSLIAAIPEMLDRLCDHCEWCADCDWQHDPDQECRFGQLWKKVGIKW